MKTFIYGPPGVGKTTLVKARNGFDLEDVWPHRGTLDERRRSALLRFKEQRIPADAFIGAAGMSPELLREAYPDARHILLLPPRSVYDARRKLRDIAQPGKKNQPDVYNGFGKDRSKFDEVWSDWSLE